MNILVGGGGGGASYERWTHFRNLLNSAQHRSDFQWPYSHTLQGFSQRSNSLMWEGDCQNKSGPTQIGLRGSNIFI